MAEAAFAKHIVPAEGPRRGQGIPVRQAAISHFGAINRGGFRVAPPRGQPPLAEAASSRHRLFWRHEAPIGCFDDIG